MYKLLPSCSYSFLRGKELCIVLHFNVDFHLTEVELTTFEYSNHDLVVTLLEPLVLLH